MFLKRYRDLCKLKYVRTSSTSYDCLTAILLTVYKRSAILDKLSSVEFHNTRGSAFCCYATEELLRSQAHLGDSTVIQEGIPR